MDLLIFINAIGIFTINKVSAFDECVDHWEFKNPIDWCCDVDYRCCGPNQSPIDIQTREVTRYEKCLIFHKYEKLPDSLALHNNKYTIQLLHKGDAYVTYADVKYRFDRATFHFGQTSALGSMHTINRQQFPMEMHLVHINNKYDSIEEAKEHKDGLLIVAVFFMPTFHDNNDLRNIIYDLHYVMWKGDVLCIKPFPLKQLLPLRYRYHYSYDGSLPFPPCTESVKWVVLHMPVYISEYQLGQFRKMQLTTHKKCPNGKCPMWNNRRRAICYEYRERDNDSEPIMTFYGSTYRPRTVVWGRECDEVAIC